MGFGDRNNFLLRVYYPDSARDLGHIAHTAKNTRKLLPLTAENEKFLLRKQLVILFFKRLEFFKTLNTFGNGVEVGEHSAEPTLVDIRHPNPGGLRSDWLLRLLLGANEEHRTAVGDRLSDEFVCLVDVRE